MRDKPAHLLSVPRSVSQADGRGRRRRSIVVAGVIFALLVASLYGLVTYRPASTTAQAVPQALITPARDRPLAVFLGDSYTAGTGATTDSSRWSSLVAQERGWHELNFGLGGTGYATSAGVNGCGQKYCPSYRESVKEIAQLQPDVVVVAGGQNDFATSESKPATVTRAIGATIEGLRKSLPDAQIIVVGPSTPSGAGDTAVTMEAAVRRAAKGADATFISLLEPRPVIRGPMVLPDKVHVNDSGHAAIARRVLDGLS